jgi:nucleoside-diphosphate-sugar epimerase
MRALVGHTGFIGSHLLRQSDFDFCFNTKNISEITRNSYNQLVFAGLPGIKWKANTDPLTDRKNIDDLINQLSRVSVDDVTYISTIDVYNNQIDINEDDGICFEHNPYGSNRAYFEKFILNTFKNCTVVRPPIVYGKGFKKNYLFDLMQKNNLQAVHLKNKIQLYDVTNLTADINYAKEKNLKILNLATEPVELSEIVSLYFPNLINCCQDIHSFSSNMKTKYTKSGYLQSKKEVLQKIGTFIN